MRLPVIKLKAELSAFFALIFLIIASLLLNLVEAARTQGARTYFTMAADSAMDSLFSQYHRQLWEDYRLLGLEMYSPDEITDEYCGFLKPYITDTRNWYALTTQKGGTEILTYELMTDSNGSVLRREIIDYMKFGLAFSVMELSDMLEFKDLLKDGNACSEISSEYSSCAREAERIERILRDLSGSISEHNTESASVRAAISSHSAQGFYESSGRLSVLLSEICSEVEDFSYAASELSVAVSEASADFEARFASGDLSQSSYETLKTELSEYGKYCDENGEVRSRIEGLRDISDINRSVLSDTEEKVDEAVAYLENFVPGEVLIGYLPPETEGGDPIPVYEEEEPDEDAAWAPAASAFSSYRKMESPVRVGNPDTEKEEKLNSVRDLLSENMLSLILPEEYKTPGVPLDLTDKPSAVFAEAEDGEPDETLLSDRIFITEYILQMLSFYNEKGSSERHLEAEYVIYGNDTDSANLSSMVGETVAIRTGLNLIYLLKDSKKREMATRLSLSITGLASATPLSTVVFILILSTWALGQAVLDVRDLLHGNRVPVMHTGESFYLSLEGLISNFPEIVKGSHNSSSGLDYEAYLRLLLFLHMDAEREYRILDVIQMNIRNGQPDFLIERLYTNIRLETETASSHLFGGNEGGYRFKVKTFYSY